MGHLYQEWLKQYQATDQLMSIMFIFGMLLMVGYYSADLLPWDPKHIKWIKNVQAAVIISIIIMTLAAPTLVDKGIIVMD